LPQKDLGQLAAGQSVHLAVTGLEQSFSGEITAINAKVDPATRNVLIEARIPNPDGKLKPGMFAHVQIDSGEAIPRLTLPQTAIAYNPYGSTVFVVHEKTWKDDQGKTVHGKVVE